MFGPAFSGCAQRPSQRRLAYAGVEGSALKANRRVGLRTRHLREEITTANGKQKREGKQHSKTRYTAACRSPSNKIAWHTVKAIRACGLPHAHMAQG